jgi:tRNA threonylcarbamoyladenosine biosynthesis protein TsaB
VKLLALDTATEACSVALSVDGALSFREAVIGRGHAERVLEMVEELLVERGLALGALDAIAFGRGPGAFTGVRIAVSIAQGLAFGVQCPTVAVSDLAALGKQALDRADRELGPEPAAEALVALDARMGEVYFARARRTAAGGVALAEEGLGAPGAVFVDLPPAPRRVVAGHGFGRYPGLAERAGGALAAAWPELLPRAREVAELGVVAVRAGEAVPAESAEPVYLRNDVATRSGRGQAE